MVVEYIRYRGEQILPQATRCLGYEVSHGVGEPENYGVRIEWRIQEMRHSAPTGIVSAP